MMAWVSKNCQVGYFEPLCLWTLKLADLPKNESPSAYQFVDDWKPRAYQTSFMMKSNDGQEIGVATLDYTPPFVKKVCQSVDDEFELDQLD